MSKPLTREDKANKRKRYEALLKDSTISPEEQLEIARVMLAGKYMTYDVYKAFELITVAADKGYGPAKVALSSFYSLGMAGNKIDNQRAYDLVLEEAAIGNKAAIAIKDVLYNRLNPKEEITTND